MAAMAIGCLRFISRQHDYEVRHKTAIPLLVVRGPKK